MCTVFSHNILETTILHNTVKEDNYHKDIYKTVFTVFVVLQTYQTLVYLSFNAIYIDTCKCLLLNAENFKTKIAAQIEAWL